MIDAAWKGLDRETVEDFMESRGDATGLASWANVIDALGLRCVGWHNWTGDPATSTPLFVLDDWPT